MKMFKMPAIEVMKFETEDIITVSGGEVTTTEEELGAWPLPCIQTS